MNQILTDLSAQVVPLAKSLVFAIIVFVVGLKLVNFAVKKIKNGKVFKNMDASAAGFICSFISIALKIIVIISVITILGIPMTSVITLLASAGVAVGLAVQGALSNLVGGMMILLFKPFRAGDFIESQAVSGTVREISVFYTVIVTPDNKVITVPNGGLTNAIVTNYSAEELRRVDIDFSADYDNDISAVKSAMLEVAANCEKALSDPEPAAVITNCGDNGIEYALRVWCKGSDYWDVRFALIEGVRNKFKDNNIDIPYPQLDVRIKNDK
ncbi:MAG: mechanosensitive ion channel [Clostridia bacterium]|nr:mechanosensitive ion channel [Clostridia bacterium]